MNSIKIETKTNGYEATVLQDMISKFDKAAAKLFPGCKVRHFYYGDFLDMAVVVLGEHVCADYANFNIYAARVSLVGYSCRDENLRKFESMTFRDELYTGRLLELAE